MLVQGEGGDKRAILGYTVLVNAFRYLIYVYLKWDPVYGIMHILGLTLG